MRERRESAVTRWITTAEVPAGNRRDTGAFQVTARSRIARNVCSSTPRWTRSAVPRTDVVPMTRDQIARVRADWALVVPVASTFAALCYDRLFALDPSLRALFTRTDAVSLQRKLVQTFGMIVAGIDDLDQLTPAIQVLGQRHAGYGVTEAHYRTMRDAFLWTFDCALGDAFDDAARRAWEAAYERVTGIMQNAHAIPVVIATTDRDR